MCMFAILEVCTEVLMYNMFGWNQLNLGCCLRCELFSECWSLCFQRTAHQSVFGKPTDHIALLTVKDRNTCMTLLMPSSPSCNPRRSTSQAPVWPSGFILSGRKVVGTCHSGSHPVIVYCDSERAGDVANTPASASPTPPPTSKADSAKGQFYSSL